MTVAAAADRILNRRLTRIDERQEALASAMESLGWPAASIGRLEAKTPGARLIELEGGGEPQALLVVGSGAAGHRAGSVALGYTREAPYTLWWSGEDLALAESRRWEHCPGDTAIGLDADRADRTAVLELLHRDSILNREPSLYIRRGEEHAALHDRLALALAQLRLVAAQRDAFKGREPSEQDNAVLRLFHQLLFVRFQEDWGRSPADRSLASLLKAPRPQANLRGILDEFRRHLNSELFEDAGVDVDQLPAESLREVLKALVEPWHELQLNFSVSRAEIASRLYQSYLKLAPAVEDDAETLFPLVGRVDEREVRASYYTPVGLAEFLCEQTLGAWLEEHEPDDPSDVRVLDPACGSGTFLLAAFRVLERYFEARSPQERLGNDVRLGIVTKSLYGADIDERAIALARIQLLEAASIDGRGPLPDLNRNLLVGDSLSAPGGDPAEGAVDWDDVTGGRLFDVVLANPPFGSQSQLPTRIADADRAEVRARFPEVRDWGSDYAYLFLALTLRLTDESSRIGFILPAPALEGKSARTARATMLERGVDSIANFRGLRLFDNSAYVVAVVLGRGKGAEVIDVPDSRAGKTRVLDALRDPSQSGLRRGEVSKRVLAETMDDGWTPFNLRWRTLAKEITREVEPLAPPRGRGADRFVVHGTQPGSKRLTLPEGEWRRENGSIQIGEATVPVRYAPRLVRGRDIRPFSLLGGDERLLVPFEDDGLPAADPEVESALEQRGGLPAHAQPGDLRTLRRPKLLIRRLAFEPSAAVDAKGEMIVEKGSGGGLALYLKGADSAMLKGAEALFHSSVYQWLLRGFGRAKADESIELHVSDLAALPWPVEFFDAEWSELAAAGAAVHAALALDSDERLDAYWTARAGLDDLALDLFGVRKGLKRVIADELMRRG